MSRHDTVDALLLPAGCGEGQRIHYADAGADLDLVVLSKDRACQLDALLRSIRAYLTVPHRIHVLYTSSNLAYERGYDRLRRWHPGIDWVHEARTFRRTYLTLLESIAAGPGRFLMPVMDDMIFTREFTAQPLLEMLDRDDDVLAVSLRLGENITHCYVRSIDTTPPDFTNGHRWAWKTASSGYWNYPMSMDANVYRAKEMAEYAALLPFRKAERVEASMSRRPIDRPHLVCEATPCVLNLAVNRVQHTFDNRHGTTTAEALNAAFLAGFAIDLRPLVGRTFDSCHVDVELSLVPDHRPVAPSAAAPSAVGWRPQRRDGVSSDVRGEDRILTCAEGGEPVRVNATAAAIWDLCDGTRTVDDIEAELAEHFDGDRNVVRRDLQRIVDAFVERGLVAPLRPTAGYRRVDLREVPWFVINCRQDTEKRAFMERQLVELGVPFEMVPGVKSDPGWIGVALSHLKVLRLSRADTPFLVLEDECFFNDRYHPVWDVPTEADALYLGVSEFGIPRPGVFGRGRAGNVRWEPYDRNYLRVFNMLGRHAVLYLSPEYCEKVIASQIAALTHTSDPYPGDIGCAMLQATHVVLTPNDPVCRQVLQDSTARSLRESGSGDA